MRNKLKSYYGQGYLHFVAFSCYLRLSLLGRVRGREETENENAEKTRTLEKHKRAAPKTESATRRDPSLRSG